MNLKQWQYVFSTRTALARAYGISLPGSYRGELGKEIYTQGTTDQLLGAAIRLGLIDNETLQVLDDDYRDNLQRLAELLRCANATYQSHSNAVSQVSRCKGNGECGCRAGSQEP